MEIELTSFDYEGLASPVSSPYSTREMARALRASSIAHLTTADVARLKGKRVPLMEDGFNRWFKFQVLKFFGFRIVEEDYVKRFRAIHPESTFALAWNVLHGALLLYLAIFSPLQAAFPVEMCVDGLTAFNNAVDIFFLLDVALNFVLAYKKPGEHGLFVDDLKQISNHYVKSGSFIIDLLLSIPVSWIQFALFPNCGLESRSQFLIVPRILRLIRIVRVLRVVRLFKMFFFSYISANLFVLKLVKLSIAMLVLVHMGACCFWLIKSSDDKLLQWEQDQGMIDSNIGDKYCASLYFAVATFTTVGYGDIHATNTIERAFVLVMLLTGAAVFATLISNISSMVASATSKDTKHQEKLTRVREFVGYWKVPKELAKKIEEFYQYNNEVAPWKVNLELMYELPALLRTELCAQLAQNVVGKVKIFKDAPEEYIALIFLALRPFRCAPAETIMMEGQQSAEVFIIVRGEVKIMLSNGFTVEVLHPGELFGESAIVNRNERRSVNAVAAKFCELMVLNVADIDAANQQFPEMQMKMMSVAKKKMRKFEQSRKASIYGLKMMPGMSPVSSEPSDQPLQEDRDEHDPTHKSTEDGDDNYSDAQSYKGDDTTPTTAAATINLNFNNNNNNNHVNSNFNDNGAGISGDVVACHPSADSSNDINSNNNNNNNNDSKSWPMPPPAPIWQGDRFVSPQQRNTSSSSMPAPPPLPIWQGDRFVSQPTSSSMPAPPPVPIWQGDRFVAPSWSQSNSISRGLGQSIGDGFDRNVLMNDFRQRRVSMQLSNRGSLSLSVHATNFNNNDNSGSNSSIVVSPSHSSSSSSSNNNNNSNNNNSNNPNPNPNPNRGSIKKKQTGGNLSILASLSEAESPKESKRNSMTAAQQRKRSVTTIEMPTEDRKLRSFSTEDNNKNLATDVATPKIATPISPISPTSPSSPLSRRRSSSPGRLRPRANSADPRLHGGDSDAAAAAAAAANNNNDDSNNALNIQRKVVEEEDSWGPRTRKSRTVVVRSSSNDFMSEVVKKDDVKQEEQPTLITPPAAIIEQQNCWDEQTCNEIREMIDLLHKSLESMELREMAKLVDNVRVLGLDEAEKSAVNKNKMQQLAYKVLSASQRLSALAR